MSAPTFVIFAGGLVAVFLLIVAALVWQEAKSRTYDEGPVYVIEDAVDFVMGRLGAGSQLARSDVLRILEWEIYYLQGLAQDNRHNPVETVAGGDTAAVGYITAQIAEKNNVTYDSGDVAAVLAVEADYLASIGAVGGRVVDEQEDDPS
ncbi:MAG TPA: hypothetical protein VIW46_00810 [Acidimicrobiia bacterium]|jgi:hypothetical protein